eukprot:117015-Ditylum_brightwellii.AAC.1
MSPPTVEVKKSNYEEKKQNWKNQRKEKCSPTHFHQINFHPLETEFDRSLDAIDDYTFRNSTH